MISLGDFIRFSMIYDYDTDSLRKNKDQQSLNKFVGGL